jgi:hypothetical protein
MNTQNLVISFTNKVGKNEKKKEKVIKAKESGQAFRATSI